MTVLAIAFVQLPSKAKPEPTPFNKPSQLQALKPIKKLDEPTVKPKETLPVAEATVSQPTAKTVAATTPQAPARSCEAAIAAVWPASLQTGARLVSVKESSLNPDQIGPIREDGSTGYNYDGSRDYGCFQINNKAHPDFFSGGDWRDPYYNAQYALKTYQERGNWTAWYAVRGILW